MPFDEIEFAVKRSNNAAIAANENSRPMSQYALLINGAAASAIIAFLSKDKIDPTVLAAAPWALGSYAIGVVFGAIAMFCMTESLDYWNSYWEKIARAEGRTVADWERSKGIILWWFVRISVGISIFCFLVGSGLLAHALLHAVPHTTIFCDLNL